MWNNTISEIDAGEYLYNILLKDFFKKTTEKAICIKERIAKLDYI